MNDRDVKKTPPCVFLCHATEDKQLVERIACNLQREGIDTFFDKWEITSGDSIRQKIDAGLDRCTHFIALLTPNSINKSWVNTEMDAGFVKMVSGECKFIPLRKDLSVEKLSPLLRGRHSPSLDDYERDIAGLIHDIHGVTSKPPLGEEPQIIAQSSHGALGLSPAAESIVKLMIEQSEHGLSYDPAIEADEIWKQTGLNDDDIIDAVDELCDSGFIGKRMHMGCGPIGFGAVYSKEALFTELDKYYKEWDSEEDAIHIAADLVNSGEDGLVSAIAEKYNWTPRRMNPAVNYLIERDLVDAPKMAGGHPWCCHFIMKKPETRRFIRDRL